MTNFELPSAVSFKARDLDHASTPNYTCVECGGPVTITDGEIHRPCGHADTGVVADLQATAYGVGGMES